MRRTRSERRALKRANIAPPLRGGINASEIILPEFDVNGVPVSFRTLGEWAVNNWGEVALAAFARGDYLADGNLLLSADSPYQPGMRIWVFRPVLDEPANPIKLSVVSETKQYVVVEKPHGMATIPRGSHVANTVTVVARRQFKNDLLVAAHRLDLETAGLVLLTKAPEYRAKYQTIFQRREIQKTYLAAAPILDAFLDGDPQEIDLPLFRPAGQIGVEVFTDGVIEKNSAPLATAVVANEAREEFLAAGGRIWNSRTQVCLVRKVNREALPDCSMDSVNCEFLAKLSNHPDFLQLPVQWGIYELRPHTGYLHQLRVVMNYLGAPIFGDPLYPVWLTKEAEEARAFPLQLLARDLEFRDPDTREVLHFSASQKLLLDF